MKIIEEKKVSYIPCSRNCSDVFSREVTVAAILICLVIVTSPPIKYALNLGKLLNVVILILR